MSMILIQRQVLSSSAASVTFSNILQNYRTLKLVVSARDDTSGGGITNNLWISFNGSPSGSAYSNRVLFGNGSSASSASETGDSKFVYQYMTSTGATTNTFGSAEMTIPNYSGSANKVMSSDSVSEHNGTSAIQGLSASLWASSAAITSIVLQPASGNFVANSSFSLYGLL